MTTHGRMGDVKPPKVRNTQVAKTEWNAVKLEFAPTPEGKWHPAPPKFGDNWARLYSDPNNKGKPFRFALSGGPHA